MSLEQVQERCKQLQAEVRWWIRSMKCTMARLLPAYTAATRALTLKQVEADEAKLMRLQSGSDTVTPEVRAKVEKVGGDASHAPTECLQGCMSKLVTYIWLAFAARAQKFGVNMDHWKKRKGIFKSIWWALLCL